MSDIYREKKQAAEIQVKRGLAPILKELANANYKNKKQRPKVLFQLCTIRNISIVTLEKLKGSTSMVTQLWQKQECRKNLSPIDLILYINNAQTFVKFK